MSTVNFEHLFTPLQVGPMRVPNRICETTNTINSSMTPGLIDDHFIAHHVAKARGGTGDWKSAGTWRRSCRAHRADRHAGSQQRAAKSDLCAVSR